MNAHDDTELLADARYAGQSRDRGLAWGVIAAELGCTTDHARRLARHWDQHCTLRAAAEQLTLF
ncbi:hypothetical protein FOS14_22085 [Skermania sp. ID1734]|uniref:hypothetical protein n=1 Tax=Skermania sp. ID1734 TaxID=2597516 RepID=UPI00117D1E4D|nr:hypothetical protein [Skermania sp. ID1734]TSD93756.1 hypothetical protein FOS14_22085 [Skermania sp. ID1734]